MNATSNSFVRLASINVNDHVERKQGLAYLSWAWAVDTLLRADPTATWEYRDCNGAPYLSLPDGTAMVFCTVTAFGQARSMQLPVMDHRNRAIANPDAFAVNTAMQRALVKAIALHGIGLYVYAGEDLPNAGGEDVPPKVTNRTTKVTPLSDATGDLITPAQLKFVQRLIVETEADTEQLLAYFGYESIDAIPKAVVSRVIKALEAKKRRAA
jgi:hypothetical protein